MHRLLGVGLSGLVCLWATAASASNILTPGVGSGGSGFASLPSPPSLMVPAVDANPGVVGATFALPVAASSVTSPVPTRGVFGIQPSGGKVTIDGLIVRRPLGETPSVAAPEPGTIVTALVGVAAVLIGRRMRAR